MQTPAPQSGQSVEKTPPGDAKPPCWKMIYLARRNPGLTAEDFAQAWREHSALGRQCRNVQEKVLGVTQCTRLRSAGQSTAEDGGLRGASTDYDGVNLLQLRDLSVASDLWSDPETLAIMRPDEPRVFSTYVRNFTLVCREHVLRDGPSGEVVLFGFVRRSACLSQLEFEAAWAESRPGGWPAASVLQGALRTVHNSVVQAPPEGYDYDGIAEWWFANADAARAALGGSGAGNLRSHLPAAYGALIDLERSIFMFTQVSHRRP